VVRTSGARSVRRPPSTLLCAAGSLGVVAFGAFGPWAKRFGLPVDGSDDELVGLLALVAGVALVVFALTRSRRLATVPLLAGLVSAMVIGHDVQDPAGPFGGPGPNIHLEWGIWLALGGSIGLLFASVVLLVQTAGTAGRPGRAISGKVRNTIRGRTRILGAFSDDTVVHDFAKRLGRPDERGAELLTKLVGELRPKVASALVDGLTPTGELDYAPHRIQLVVSSPRVVSRLSSVEKEPFTVEWIERSINPGDVFYDIGANVGAYSLIAAKATGNRARVFAFEPSPSSFRDLFRNVLLNDCAESVTPLPLVLWSESRLLSFRFRSLRSGAARHRVSSHLGLGGPLVTRVLGVCLDDLVERFGVPVPNHAKIDVDGAELEVLRGAVRTLRRPEWRSIIIELDPGDTKRNRAIKALLAEAGFDSGLLHERLPTARYPDLKDIYWTFIRGPTR
jgi:FkbM family methyltransferase